MKCEKCKEKAITTNPNYCEVHFKEYIEQKVKHTIEKYELIKNTDKVVVAASGGKDSMVLLYLLHKFGYNVEALAIDEGIENYRDHTLEFLANFCKKNELTLKIVSYQEAIGKRLDEIIPKGRPACAVCGTFRRDLLNKHATEYDKIATGHNMDDETQAILMNLFRAQTKLFARQGPKTRKIKGFTQKIKPLYFVKEKEVMIYSFLLGLNTAFNECPYAQDSFRAQLRDILNEYESKNPGTKKNILNKYLELVKETNFEKQDIGKCKECQSPTSEEICKACRLKKNIQKINLKKN